MATIDEAREDDLPRILAITNEAIATTTSVWNVLPATLAMRSA